MGKRMVRFGVATGAFTALSVLAASGLAWADSTGSNIPGPEELDKVGIGLNLLWIVMGAVLVIFMQAGFALVETGFCRAKHAAHVVSTNFAIFGLGFVGFFLVGWSFMFGGFSYPGYFGMDERVGAELIGSGHWVFLWKGGFAMTGGAYDVSVLAFFLYMVAFMDTTATIPTGSMAERWRWNSFVKWGLFCGAIYYPLFGAWTWGGGWLSQLGNSLDLGFGYVDFAGSGVVHAMGGCAALMGALVLGPRIGKYDRDGNPRVLPAHHLPMAMLGTFILLFGWFGFNAASTFSATDLRFAVVAANTAIAGAFGAVGAMFWAMKRLGKPDPGMMANGMLAGLVAITAPCAFVQPWAAAVIGGIAGVLVIESILFFERKAKIDDPVGAISVHGICGSFGVLCVGIFADGNYGGGWNLTDSTITADKGLTGIFYDFELGIRQLAAQTIGVATIWLVMGTIVYLFFKLQGKSIRSKREDELEGLDEPEMGMLAYPEFAKADVEDLVPFDGDDLRPKTPKANGRSRPDKVEAGDIKV
ncbi:MAG TPA: ammonium transporter [Acidimicrobiales bacterium]|nr:ammonium transporter [Acidimicrobiales bacterium]